MTPPENNPRFRPLDGGWGWVCVFGLGITLGCISGTERSFGVTYIALREKYEESAAKTAWVGGVMSACRTVFAAFGAYLANRYSARLAVFIGCLLRSTGYILSAFALNLDVLFLTMSVLSGFGGALIQTPAMAVVGLYFDKKRSTALGISFAIAGIGSFGIPLLMELFFEQYGYGGAMLLLGGISFHGLIGAVTFRPLQDNYPAITRTVNPHTDGSDSSQPTIKFSESDIGQNDAKTTEAKIETQTVERGHPRHLDFSVLLKPAFVMLCLTIMLSFSGTVSTFFLLPALASSRGISHIRATFLLSIVGIVDVVWRMPLGFLYDYFRHKRLLLFSLMLFLCASSVYCLATAATYAQFVMCVIVFGLASSSMVSQRTTIIVDLLGPDRLTSSLAISAFFQGIGNMAGPPLAGLLRDHHDYGASFMFCASAILASAVLMTSSVMYTNWSSQHAQGGSIKSRE